MKDKEFSGVGAEYNQAGREFEPAAREWNMPAAQEWNVSAAEVDCSGREYGQESGARSAGKKRKRRINPAMATVAAVATAAVVVSPINRVIKELPTYALSAASRAYLDYAVETVKEGDWDELLAAAEDSRLDDVIREGYAPYAMELALEYDYQYAAYGMEGDDCRTWTSLDQFINASHYNVVYDGSVLTRSGMGGEEGEFRCGKWLVEEDETTSSWHVDQEWIEAVEMELPVQYASAYTHVHTDKNSGRRSIDLHWEGGTFRYVEILDEPNHYTLIQVDGIRKNANWNDSGAGTTKDDVWEEVCEGDFIYEWIVDDENGGHHRDYLENGTVTYRSEVNGRKEFQVSIKVENGSVVLESGKLSVEQDQQGDIYDLVLWYGDDSGEGASQRTIHSGPAESEEDFLYHLY